MKRDPYEDYFANSSYYVMMYWDVGAWCTRKAVRDKITTTQGRLLELGCGLGIALVDIAGFDRKIGLEYGLNTIQIAREHKDANTEFVNGDAQHLPFRAESFEVVISQHMLEHIPNDQQVIDECHRVLKRGGELIVFVAGRLSEKSSREEFIKKEIKKWGHFQYYNEARFREGSVPKKLDSVVM